MEGEETEAVIHPAVELLLARMESHPKEFADDVRWASRYQPFKAHWNGAEKRLFTAKLREIRMQVMHEKIMQELLR
jgi:hypothetical protein